MKDPYLYTNSEVLKNLAGIHDAEELKNMEADYTLLRLSYLAPSFGDCGRRFTGKVQFPNTLRTSLSDFSGCIRMGWKTESD